ncbi:late competence development ComFB family protein [Thioalkalivibrio sp.]|uniref:late competence development ComFB family protein n=1 Tax=Thioalkalivibrio sp. TaxID=2093813 RepID=UPI003976AFFA
MAFEIVNYYEALVVSAVHRYAREHLPGEPVDETTLQDAACIALNQLPPRYIRHHVDAAFYLSTDERTEMEAAVEESVRHAFDHLSGETARDR